MSSMFPDDRELLAQGGPWRFTSYVPDRLAWWVAVLFGAGSLLFVIGAGASLVPSLFGDQHTMSVVAESCYTLGAVLYTVSVYGQVLEHLNADDRITTEQGSRPPRHW